MRCILLLENTDFCRPLKTYCILQNYYSYTCTVVQLCCLTIHMTVKFHTCSIVHTGLNRTGKFLLLHFAVEGAVCAIGEGGHAGFHAAAGGASGSGSPPRVPHHQHPLARTQL